MTSRTGGLCLPSTRGHPGAMQCRRALIGSPSVCAFAHGSQRHGMAAHPPPPTSPHLLDPRCSSSTNPAATPGAGSKGAGSSSSGGGGGGAGAAGGSSGSGGGAPGGASGDAASTGDNIPHNLCPQRSSADPGPTSISMPMSVAERTASEADPDRMEDDLSTGQSEMQARARWVAAAGQWAELRVPSRAHPSRAHPSRAHPSRAHPSVPPPPSHPRRRASAGCLTRTRRSRCRYGSKRPMASTREPPRARRPSPLPGRRPAQRLALPASRVSTLSAGRKGRPPRPSSAGCR